ncbi:MAG: hypothetical protein AVDCRST_MAG02-662, partial [uncultured Rubrobacteraceae bacterium]
AEVEPAGQTARPGNNRTTVAKTGIGATRQPAMDRGREQAQDQRL